MVIAHPEQPARESRRTALLYDEVLLRHRTHTGHPESPMRLSTSYRYLSGQAWFSQIEQIKAPPPPAGEKWLAQVHTSDYLVRAKAACKNGEPFLDVADVSISRESFQVAEYAVSGSLKLADQIVAGEQKNGFALLRPPGHHAERHTALGFCILNNAAVLARYLQMRYGMEKIAIFDWDVHHGNGTQHIFEEDPSVLYVSIHQYPFYPGTGAASETGIGPGKGATLNCPVSIHSDDTTYAKVLREKVLPKLRSFSPEVLIISAGFDAHRDDPLGQINLSTAFYRTMTEQVLESTEKSTGGRTISLLEGGYNLDVLAHSIESHLLGLMTK